VYYAIESKAAVQGHPRSLISAPIQSAYATSCLAPFLRCGDINAKNRNFSRPPIILCPRISGQTLLDRIGLSDDKDFVIPHVVKAARELDRASLRRNHRTTLCHPNISLGITLDAENGGEFHLTVSERTK